MIVRGWLKPVGVISRSELEYLQGDGLNDDSVLLLAMRLKSILDKRSPLRST